MSSAFVPPPGAQRTGTHTSRADALRAQLESSLGHRFPGALTPPPREVRETMPTGVDALDAMLDGGLPLGSITELVGPLCSGRTGVALSTVAAAMREGSMCAWVDASDAFDPESAAANGVRLEQLLWVRCGVVPPSSQGQGEMAVGTMTQAPGEIRTQVQARAGQHPRDEVRGLDTAVGELLRGSPDGRRDRSIGTPGAPNRSWPKSNSLAKGPASGTSGHAADGKDAPKTHGQARTFEPFRSVPHDEQVSTDRQPRRGRSGAAASPGSSNLSQEAGRQHVQPIAASPSPASSTYADKAQRSAKPWSRLDQALRAADLLLQAGGFRVLVLDLASMAPEHVLRIPLASWFRFRAAADANRTLLLVLTQTSCARSSAGLVVCFAALKVKGANATNVDTDAVRAHPGRALQLVEQQRAMPAHLAGCSVAARSEAKIMESIRYQATPLRQQFTSHTLQAAGVSADVGARRSQATWQVSAYPDRERLA